MQKSIAIVVDWFGPYDLGAAKSISSGYFPKGAYVAIGKTPRQQFSSVQYIGISSTDLHARLTPTHHKLQKIMDLKLWLGAVTSAGVPGRKEKWTDTQLDSLEWVYAHGLDLPLNERKKQPPRRPVTVVNRWWKPDFDTQYKRRPGPRWPLVLDYPGEPYAVQLFW